MDYDITQTVANHSEIVAFNPTTKHFCTYLLPGNDNEVMGVAWTSGWIWFVETGGLSGTPRLDGFDPTTISGCSNTANKAILLPTSVQLLNLPTGPGGVQSNPLLVTPDPSGTALWISSYGAWSGVRKIDISTPSAPVLAADFSLPSTNTNSIFGAFPWEIAVDSNSVYAIEYGDDNLARIDKTTGTIDRVPLPVTSDREQGYGLAIYGTKLYFTLADDLPPSFGGDSTFGYIDLSSWAPSSQPTSAAVYTGLPAITNPTTAPDYRGIAADPAGQLGITDLKVIARITP